MFLGLPDPDPLVRGMDPDTDPALDPVDSPDYVWSVKKKHTVQPIKNIL